MTGSTSGCGGAVNASAALPYLGKLMGWLAQGFAMEAGRIVAGQIPREVGEAYSKLAAVLKGDGMEAVYGFSRVHLAGGRLGALVAGYLLDGDRVNSRAVHDNGGELIYVPTVLSMGLGALGQKMLAASLNHESRPDRETAAAWVREALTVDTWEMVEGDDEIDKRGRYRALIAGGHNVEVEWDPSKSLTTQTRLTVRRGLLLQGRDPQWYPHDSIDIGIPYRELWGDPT